MNKDVLPQLRRIRLPLNLHEIAKVTAVLSRKLTRN